MNQPPGSASNSPILRFLSIYLILLLLLPPLTTPAGQADTTSAFAPPLDSLPHFPTGGPPVLPHSLVEEKVPEEGGVSSAASTATLTIHPTVVGTTTTYIGATEAAGFWVDDLADLEVNTYRLWTKMAELEWWDDDDAMDSDPWNDNRYGTPTIAEIRADAGSGFTNTIPWAWWDERFDEVQSWRYGVQTRRGIVEALVQNGVTPLVVLRTYDDQGQPEQRPQARWAPRPPPDEAFRNEWWEHCFAFAYWLNVRNDYRVTHFEVLNEPDYPGQGWIEYGGTMTGYVQLVLDAHDAISYANSFASLPVYIHAPVVANYASPYVSYSLDHADAAVQVVDYHNYADDVRPGIVGIRNTIHNHNPDGTLEPIWNSEWGALWDSYNTFDRAMLTANQLLTFSEEEVEGVTLFNMYDWSTTPGQDYGLVDLQDDGQGGALRAPTESYYAFRLMTRGLVGGKERLQVTANGFDPDTRVMATQDDHNVYVILLQNDISSSVTTTVDLSELGVGLGEATVFEYSAAHKDEAVAFPVLTAGLLTFVAPVNGISLVAIPRPQASAATKAVTLPTAAPGNALHYTVVLSNSGAVGPASTRLTDTLPTGLTWADRLTVTSGTAGYANGVVTWTGSLLPQAPVTVTFAVTVSWLPAGMLLTNTATVHDELHLPFQTNWVTTTVGQVAGVRLPPNRSGVSEPGTVISYVQALTNTGNGTDSFAITHASSQGWPVAYDTPIVLDGGQAAPLLLSITVPTGVPSGTLDTTVVTATSQVDPTAHAHTRITTFASRRHWEIFLPIVLHNQTKREH